MNWLRVILIAVLVIVAIVTFIHVVVLMWNGCDKDIWFYMKLGLYVVVIIACLALIGISFFLSGCPKKKTKMVAAKKDDGGLLQVVSDDDQ